MSEDKYKYVIEYSLLDLQTELNSPKYKGWIPVGGVTVIKGTLDETRSDTYIQLLFRTHTSKPTSDVSIEPITLNKTK